MTKEEQLNKIIELTQKKVNILQIAKELEINEFVILNLIKELRNKGINITSQLNDDGLYFFNLGETETKDKTFSVQTNEKNEYKFVAISDTRIGSKFQQLNILYDIYQKAKEMGFNNVILCGNITEGLYSIKDKYAEDNFLDDSLKQIEYIKNYFPKIDGMTTYFVTGAKDEKHMLKNKINIGRRISEVRDDLIYLGENSCMFMIDKAKMLIFNSKLGKTYTVSYRPQQQIDSFRSEDKPDILLYGGLLQMEKFNYRNVDCISVPSVVATTNEMTDKRHSNTIGAWYITVKTNEKGQLEKITGIDSVYYRSDRDDYLKPKVLKRGGKK